MVRKPVHAFSPFKAPPGQRPPPACSFFPSVRDTGLFLIRDYIGQFHILAGTAIRHGFPPIAHRHRHAGRVVCVLTRLIRANVPSGEVANDGISGTVSVIDTDRNVAIKTIKVGKYPWGVPVDD